MATLERPTQPRTIVTREAPSPWPALVLIVLAFASMVLLTDWLTKPRSSCLTLPEYLMGHDCDTARLEVQEWEAEIERMAAEEAPGPPLYPRM